MDYEPYKDYFSLSNVAWNLDLLSDLNRIMSPPQCSSTARVSDSDSRECALPFYVNNGIATDPLDEDRFNSYDEFRRNGVESDLDEIDQYQHQIREVRALTEVDKNPTTAYYVNKQNKRKKKVCVFCRNNGELPTLYNSHVVKDESGKVSCPVLRKYTCPMCGTNGDTAHTVRYCPKNNSGASPGLLLLINSTRDSAGRLKVRR